jgi:hypothetical protein
VNNLVPYFFGPECGILMDSVNLIYSLGLREAEVRLKTYSSPSTLDIDAGRLGL